MNDHDSLDDRLYALGQQAPVPGVDPHADILRGRSARRRRLARRAGVTAASLVVVAVATAAQFSWVPGAGDGSDTVLEPVTEPFATTQGPSSAPTPVSPPKCSDPLAGTGSTPAEKRALADYRKAAAAILDPSARHFDRREIRRGSSVQTGHACDPVTDEMRLESLGTKIGWRAGGQLGVVLVAVSSSEAGEPEDAVARSGWTPQGGPLPAGVTQALVTRYSESGGGQAVVVVRADGLTVAVDASGVFGNNVAPGSAPASELPGLDLMLELAASPELVLPAQ